MKKQIWFLLWALSANGCGRDRGDDAGGSAPAAAATADAADAGGVKSCKVAAKPQATLALADGPTYAGSLYPLLQRSCANCHRGDIENRQNSTNCFYLKDHLANVIKRLDNAVAARIFKDANPAATNDSIRDQYPRTEWPMPPVDQPPLAAAEIDTFRAWAAAAQCTDENPLASEAPPPAPTAYSSDDEETSPKALGKLFESAACNDGPAVNTQENWDLVAPLIAADPAAASAFYDYANKAFVDGAAAAPYACNIPDFLASMGDVSGIAPVLLAHEAYGWRLTQCAIVNGYPRLSLATLSETTNTLGDRILGLNWKMISVEQATAAEVKP